MFEKSADKKRRKLSELLDDDSEGEEPVTTKVCNGVNTSI